MRTEYLLHLAQEICYADSAEDGGGWADDDLYLVGYNNDVAKTLLCEGGLKLQQSDECFCAHESLLQLHAQEEKPAAFGTRPTLLAHGFIAVVIPRPQHILQCTPIIPTATQIEFTV